MRKLFVCVLQLLGQIDIDTREWTDGVLTYSARQVVKEPQGMYCISDNYWLERCTWYRKYM